MKYKEVYLDNGATTKTDSKVLEVMKPWFCKNYGNSSSLHKKGIHSKETLEKSRSIIAKRINALPEEIIFTTGGSESNNLAIKGVAQIHKTGHIITSKIEHPSVIETCKFLRKQGFEITFLDVNKDGFINLKQLENSITKRTILVTIMHANNEIGTIQPIEKIGKLCKEKQVLFHTDAVQSFTKEKIDVKKANIDLMSLSAHKIHGPKGVGALYKKKSVNIEKQIHGGHQEQNLRAGTENIAGIVGFTKAVQLAKEEHIKKMTELRDMLISNIQQEIPDTKLNGSREKRLCNNVNISFKYVEGEGVLIHLDLKGIAVSTGSACSSQNLKPSHVLMAIGLRHDIAHGSLRFTLSRFTTKKDIDYVVKNLKEIIKNLRKISPLQKNYKYSVGVKDKSYW